MQELEQQLRDRIIATATDFVGLVEVTENSHWDDPRTPVRDKEKDEWLRMWMSRVRGWEPGAPYCAAFDGAVVAASLHQLGLQVGGFLRNWTAHVMTNVRRMKQLGLLTGLPGDASLWLARHGESERGHAGIVVSVDGNRITTVEGNTSAGPEGSQRQGDGIWLRSFGLQGRGSLSTQGFVRVSALLSLAGEGD